MKVVHVLIVYSLSVGFELGPQHVLELGLNYIVKPWCMCEGYGSCFVSVSVCYCASGYKPGLYIQSEAA